MTAHRRALLAIACAVVGAGLMVVVDRTWALALGIALLLAWVVLGAAAILAPGEPGHEEDRADGA